MTIQEIISQLTYTKGGFPERAVEEAIKRQEEITPELLRLMEEATDNLDHIASEPHYFGHVFSAYLLAQFRETRAYPVIVEFFSADQKLVEKAMGDIITEDLGRILASVCGGDTSLIRRMVEKVELDGYVRAAALQALVVLVAQDVLPREEVIGYFRDLITIKLKRDGSFVWSALVGSCCDLCADVLKDEIVQAFADGLVDDSSINLRYVEENIASGKDAALARLANDRHNQFIDDTRRELAWCACFRESHPRRNAPVAQLTGVSAGIRTEPKVGRNAPCPCGSGKKYKKCCLE